MRRLTAINIVWTPPRTCLEREHLAVVVNAAFFSSDSGLIQWSGDWARGVQTIVAEGQVSHIDPHSYMLWFRIRPHASSGVRRCRRTNAILHSARWAVGGGAVPLWNGRLREAAASHEMDRRTAVAIDA